jgi:transcriptional regulator with XRE-family HTH domain
MKLGDVLKKERRGKGLSRRGAMTSDQIAARLGLTPAEYEKLERDDPELERWFPVLCQIAVELDAPVSMLLSKTGRSDACRAGEIGALIRDAREERGKTIEAMAQALGVSIDEYVTIEKAKSPIEKYGPLMLRISEVIDQPLFNLFMPCGVPYRELNDYP